MIEYDNTNGNELDEYAAALCRETNGEEREND